MKLFKKLMGWFKWRKTRRVLLKVIKQNIKTIIKACKIEAAKYGNYCIPIKYYGKILKQNRAQRNILNNNKAADLYDNILMKTYKVDCQLGIINGTKTMKISDIKMSFNEVFKQLKKLI